MAKRIDLTGQKFNMLTVIKLDYVTELIEYKIEKEKLEVDKIDKLIEEVKEMQELLRHRTKVENEAIKLMEECKFEEAIELLATI